MPKVCEDRPVSCAAEGGLQMLRSGSYWLVFVVAPVNGILRIQVAWKNHHLAVIDASKL